MMPTALLQRNACGGIGSLRAELRVQINAGVSLALARQLVFATSATDSARSPTGTATALRSAEAVA
jgi:hypothetical protein